jgi:GNAT superfamily N-acetyltransferase
MKLNSQVTCRKARIEDLSTIVRFQLAMASETENLKLDHAICTQGVSAVFKNSHLGEYYIAENHGQVVGSMLIIPEWSDWRNGVVLWIHSVYVIPEERKSGVFKALYETIQKVGSTRDDFRGLRLYVDKRNTAAQAVYQKLGMSNHHYELYEWMRGSS